MKNQKAQRGFVKDSNQHRDLVKEFYDQDIDHKALEKALTQRKNTAKGFTNFSLEPYTGEFSDAQKKHLLNRTMVGYCHRHHKDLDGLSLEESIDLIFREDIFKEPTNIYYWEMNAQQYKERYLSDDVEPNEPFIDRPYTDELPPGSQEEFGSERARALQWAKYQGIYEQKTSIHWKLFVFLHNLVPTLENCPLGHKGDYNYLRLIFDSCFISYNDFIYDMTFDGSMLNYLNLILSQKDTPDENYAREVQELFTVGKRPFSKFTEKDVREAARLLVGCSIDGGIIVNEEGHENIPRFEHWNHDTGDKYFSSFYGNKIIRGREGEEGIEEVREFVDMLCDTDEHSIYMARRLYQFFVYPALTDEIEQKIILPLARVYKDNNYKITAPLKVLLKSEHFFENDIQNSLIKSPLEYMMGMLKEIDQINNGILFTWDNNQQEAYYSLFTPEYFGEKEKDLSYLKYQLSGTLNGYYGKELGLGIHNPPSVSGWPAYYQEPVYDLFWLNSSTLPRRIQAMNGVLRWGLWMDIIYYHGGGVQKRLNLVQYLKSFEDPKNINSFIEELIFRFLGGDPSANTRQKINQALLNDINEDHWEEEVSKIIDLTTPEKSSYQSVEWRLGNAFEVLGTTGEFHLF